MKRITADSVVLAGEGDELSLLLVRRKNPPYQGDLALPGGFLDEGEEPEKACIRELFEETGLDLSLRRGIPLAIREKKGRDPRGDTSTHPFLFHLKEKSDVTGADDAAEALWVNLRDLKKLAFDHGSILCEALSKFWMVMPNYHSGLEKIDLPSWMVKENLHFESERMAFYGGAFNPWHEGHTECLRQCPEQNIVVVPDFNPWKEGQDFDCFWKVYRRICLDLEETSFAIYPGFCGMENKNPTISWLPQTKVRRKCLLVGDDNFINFKKWASFEKIIEIVETFYVVPRIKERKELLTLKELWMDEYPDFNIEILEDHLYQNLSSTHLRASK